MLFRSTATALGLSGSISSSLSSSSSEWSPNGRLTFLRDFFWCLNKSSNRRFSSTANLGVCCTSSGNCHTIFFFFPYRGGSVVESIVKVTIGCSTPSRKTSTSHVGSLRPTMGRGAEKVWRSSVIRNLNELVGVLWENVRSNYRMIFLIHSIPLILQTALLAMSIVYAIFCT